MYVIVGNGRVARHMLCYFGQLGIPYTHWHRGLSVPFSSCLASATHVLLLIADRAIEAFISKHQDCLHQRVLVHFSAALSTRLAYAAHPLMTFTEALYPTTTYPQIPFVLDVEAPNFTALLPGLNNPHFRIPQVARTYYHAWCVLANNFSTLLWQRFFTELRDTLHLPEAAGLLFLEQTFNNLRNNYRTALTGPLVRDDHLTIEKNLQALGDHPFAEVYRACIAAYQHTKSMEQTL